MKKLIVTFFLSILFIGVYSQQLTFNRIYIPDSVYYTEPNGHSILCIDKSYLIPEISFNSNTNTGELMFLKLDSLGNIIQTKSFIKDSIYFFSGPGSFIQTNDSDYLYVGQCLLNDLSKSYINIIKLNSNLDTLWARMIKCNDTLYEEIMHLCETTNKHFLMLGVKFNINKAFIRLLVGIPRWGLSASGIA